MEPIVIFLICMAVVTVVTTGLSILYAIPQSKKRRSEYRALTYRAYSVVVGAIAMSIGLTFGVSCLFFLNEMGLLAPLFFFSFALLGCYLLLKGLRWRLEARDEYLLYRPTLGVTRLIRYEQISHVWIAVGERTGMVKGYEIYAGKLRVKVGLLAEVYHLRNFKNYLTEQLTAHDSQAEVQIIEVGP